jgi:hypothetical protein
MKVQICDIDKSPYALKEMEIEGKFSGAVINENIVVIYVKRTNSKKELEHG